MRILFLAFIVFFSGCAVIISKQPQWLMPLVYTNNYDSIWPAHKNIKHLFDPPVNAKESWYVITKGYIITTKKDTVRGYIKIAPTIFISAPDTLIAFLPLNKTETKDIENINIKQVFVVKTILNEMADTIDYIPIRMGYRDNTLWRVLAKKNKVDICYRYSFSQAFDYTNNVLDEDHYKTLVLVTREGFVVTIASTTDFGNLHSNDFNVSMLSFINKRYNQQLLLDSFKNSDAMVDYILNKENEKESMDKAKK